MSFIGMSIVGDVNRSSTRRVPQRTAEEFAEIIQAALAADGVEEVSWKQYTPYFNDGEPCVFGSYGIRSMIVDGVDLEEFPGYYGEAKDILGNRPYRWEQGEDGKRVRISDPYTGPNESRYDALDALNTALGSGAFENVLLDLFGDHAEVRVVTGDAIHVDYYEHD